MEKEKQILTSKEKQERIHKIIAEWKRRRAENEAEIREKVKTPEFKAMIQELKERNAKKGIIIPGI